MFNSLTKFGKIACSMLTKEAPSLSTITVGVTKSNVPYMFSQTQTTMVAKTVTNPNRREQDQDYFMIIYISVTQISW